MLQCRYTFCRYWYISTFVLFLNLANALWGQRIAIPIFSIIVLIGVLVLFPLLISKGVFKSHSLDFDASGLSIGKMRIPTGRIEKIIFTKPQSIFIYRKEGNWFHRIVHINVEKDQYPQAETMFSQWAKSAEVPLEK